MSVAVILQLDPAFGPGRIRRVFGDFGIPSTVRRIDQGDEIPTDLDEVRVLVVLTGPQKVAHVGTPQAPYLANVVEVIKTFVERDRPVLGIGLGAQLLAHAGGAKVYPNVKPGATPEAPATPCPEFGWGPITLPFPGGTEPMMFGLGDGVPMFHWHEDTFDLPKLPPPASAPPPPAPPPPTGNVLLASSPKTRNQAFRFKNRLFGFQFHFELLEEDIEKVLSSHGSWLASAGSTVEQVRADTRKHYARYDRLGNRLLTNFVQFLKAYRAD